MTKKVLITGVTGFAGSHLAELLAKSSDSELFGTYHSEKSISNLLDDIQKKIKLIKLNLEESEEVKKVIQDTSPDVIYHLAAIASPAYSLKNPTDTIVNNIIAQTNLLEAIRFAEITPKIIIISSADVYGKIAEVDLPINETTSLKPENPYAVSKIAQDFQGLQYAITYNLPIIRLRPFNHIGPRQSPAFVVARFAKEIAEMEKGKKEKVLKVGNLAVKRDFTDVRDMVKAYQLAAEKGIDQEVYNVGSGKSHQISKMLEQLQALSNVSFTVESDSSLFRPSDTPNMICDSSKFRTLTGWEPKIPLDETLKDTLEYWRNVV